MKENNNVFSYHYSGSTNEELERFKKKYSGTEPEESLKKIRSLDKSVDSISTTISIFIGICGTALLIAGITQLLKNVFPLHFNIILMAAGLITDAAVPFIHNRIYRTLKNLFAPKILELIKEIEQGNS